MTNSINQGKYLFFLERSFSLIPETKRAFPEAELVNFMLNPEKATLRNEAWT